MQKMKLKKRQSHQVYRDLKAKKEECEKKKNDPELALTRCMTVLENKEI